MKNNSRTIGFFLVVILFMGGVFSLITTRKNLAINSLKSEIIELKDESLKDLEKIEKEYQIKIDSIQSLKKESKSKEDSIIYIYEKQIDYIDNSSIGINIDLFTEYLSKTDSIK